MSKVFDNMLADTLQPYLEMPKVENININRPKEVFVEFTGGKRERFEDNKLSLTALQSLARLIATINGLSYNPEKSTLSGKLKDGTRVEIYQTNAVSSRFSMALRKRYPGMWGLKDFGFSPKDITWLEKAVIDKKTMLVSGGTSTGKTTVLELLADFIPMDRRLITIQDPKEIHFKTPNNLELTITETDYDKRRQQLDDLSATAMRQNPDSVIIGEIRESVLAGAFRQLSNTGHPGSMASIHANDPQGAIRRMANLIHAREGGVKDTIQEELLDTIDYIIQINRVGKGKRIARIEQF